MRPVRNLSLTLPVAFLLVTLFSVTNAFAASQNQLRVFMAKHYDPKVTFFASDDGLSGGQCKMERVFIEGKDPVHMANRTLSVKHYIPGAGMPNSGRAIILLPPTGGENILDNKWANAFCKRGFRVALLQTWELFPENDVDLKMYDRTALRAIVAILHAADYLTLTGVKSIGLLGTSLGAIQGAAAVGFDPRIKAATLIVGGIDLDEILTASDEQEIAALRNIRMGMWKLDSAGYLAALRKATVLEPGDFIGMSGPKKIFQVVATKDLTVPTANQLKLQAAFGSQEVVSVAKDHFGAVKHAALFLTTRAADFFDKNL